MIGFSGARSGNIPGAPQTTLAAKRVPLDIDHPDTCFLRCLLKGSKLSGKTKFRSGLRMQTLFEHSYVLCSRRTFRALSLSAELHVPKVVIEETEGRHASSDINWKLSAMEFLAHFFTHSWRRVFWVQATDDSNIPTVDVPQCVNLLK